MKIYTACQSDIGTTRTSNQDAVWCDDVEVHGTHIVISAVCDGIGGLEQGERASSLVIQNMKQWFQEMLSWIDVEKCEKDIIFSHLKDAAEEWNDIIRTIQKSEGIRTGTTMSVFLMLQKTYFILQVGDSRVYHYQNTLNQLTTDATVTRFVNGKTQQLLSNYMGKEDELWFSCVTGEVEKGDLFFLCGDGFYHQLKEDDIKPVYEACKKSFDTHV